ncbi:ribulose-phosphate 3-epimerase [Chlamydia sp.]|uniref:ribulose-phosphate 3-epimerase n=1 Tax=Chlamydia sp. TaxID=35827 RepID=UPI0025C4BD16|nr:ribulose-phosphate 3-epimerase [Chlamydia sp.]MBQ8498744.1 ribulose-phosphate 3-epimerase [Chlamydia sp.]
MKKQGVLIAPSIMGADLTCLGSEARNIQESGADLIHIDVMDGHFVPNITFGPGVVAAINRSTDLFLEVHAMIYTPFEFVEAFVKAGADRIVVHFEAAENLKEIISYIKKCGVQVGIAFSPETSIEFVTTFIPLCDVILLMSVHPGFCGQKFILDTIEKIRFVKKAIQASGREGSCLIEVDGGIDVESARMCREAGADILVAASYFFGKDSINIKEKVLLLRGEEHGVK